MEGNLSQGAPPPSSDPAMDSSCRRTMGSETSGLTGDNFRTLLEEEKEEEEEMDSLMAGSMFTEWTDEKHSLYLNSMEELFVKQLHDDKELLAGHSKNETMLQRNSSGQLNENNHVSSGQFKVLWNGCWQKNDIERIQPQSIGASDLHSLSKNPWIQHFRCSGKQGEVKSAIPEENGLHFTQAVRLGGTNRTSCGVVTSPKWLPADQPLLIHQDFVGSNTDQRFMNFERIQPQSIGASDLHSLSKNPWIQHFRCSGKQGEVKSAIPEENGLHFTQAVRLGGTNRTSCGVVTSPKWLPADQPLLIHQDFVGSNTEVSDQNFIEEDHDGKKCSSVCSTKRMKTLNC